MSQLYSVPFPGGPGDVVEVPDLRPVLSIHPGTGRGRRNHLTPIVIPFTSMYEYQDNEKDKVTRTGVIKKGNWKRSGYPKKV